VVAPVVTNVSTAGTLEVIYGIDYASYNRLGTPFKFLDGGPFRGPDDIIVDDYFAASDHVKVGDHVKVLKHDVRVCGIVQHGKGARKFLPITTLQDWTGAQGKASIFYVKLDTPHNDSIVQNEIHQTPGMQDYVVRSMAEYMSMMTASNLPGLSQFITVVIGVAVVIGFIVIFQAMYTAVMERTREIGILKSLGASKFYIMNVILRETTLLAVCGIIAGIITSYAVRRVVRLRFPTLPVQIQTDWIGYAIVIALIGAILGAIYPAFKAAQKDPIEALAYE
jgi:putative ABC transport system permease protein